MKSLLENSQYRISHPSLGLGNSQNGFFVVPYHGTNGLRVIVSVDQEGWDHVSVSLPNRCPNWLEMERVRRMFFRPEETVIQIHPPLEEYVDHHPFCLHLWRPTGNIVVPRPPTELVGGG